MSAAERVPDARAAYGRRGSKEEPAVYDCQRDIVDLAGNRDAGVT